MTTCQLIDGMSYPADMNVPMTETPALSPSERNAQMVERYVSGETLAAIGDSFGLTRERVRQIISKLGGSKAEESRAQRQAQKETALTERITSFLKEHQDTAMQMAKKGASRPEVVTTLGIVYPSMDLEFADEALRESGIVFDQQETANHFSDEALAAGVWYMLGAELGLAPDAKFAAINLKMSVMIELNNVLAETGITTEELATILGVIGAAQRKLSTDPSLTITGSRYNALRIELVQALGLVSQKGSAPWPPTRQTVTKRFGGWNEALESMGLSVAAKGRPKGLIKYTDEEYDEAVSDYCFFAAVEEVKPTFAGYGEWVTEEKLLGNERPSSASVRLYYGSWTDALRAALN